MIVYWRGLVNENKQIFNFNSIYDIMRVQILLIFSQAEVSLAKMEKWLALKKATGI